jgi:transposase-like protein
MGHMLHARARTTPEVRREIQNSQESLISLARRYGVNPKTVGKWRKSVISTRILPKCKRKKAGCTFSPPSTGRQSLHMRSCIPKLREPHGEILFGVPYTRRAV